FNMVRSSVCLVTGSTGVVGSALKSAVRENAAFSQMEFVWLSHTDADCRNFAALRKIFEINRPTHIIHLAARVGGLFANMNDNIGFFYDNMEMNTNVVKLCHEFQVKNGVFCLSTCVFPVDIPLPLTEEDIDKGPPHFSNEGYSISKRCLDMLVRFYREKYNYDWHCVIPTNMYGPGDNFNLEEGHVIPGLIHKCYLAKRDCTPFTIFGSGKPLRQFLYTRDAANLILNILSSTQIENASMILCSDSESGEVSIATVAKLIAEVFNFDGEVLFDTSRSDGAFQKTASNVRLRKLTGTDYTFTSLKDGELSKLASELSEFS
ncbi:GDP-L-fucose synthetase, partial [Cardiosporidium cionae]